MQLDIDRTLVTHLKWLQFVFLRYYRSMALRVFLYALLSVAATLIGPFVDTIISARFNTDIDLASVVPILTILATSMLAVSTFSLNIMVTAHRAAADKEFQMTPGSASTTVSSSRLLSSLGSSHRPLRGTIWLDKTADDPMLNVQDPVAN